MEIHVDVESERGDEEAADCLLRFRVRAVSA